MSDTSFVTDDDNDNIVKDGLGIMMVETIDLVVINLYPFMDNMLKSDVFYNECRDDSEDTATGRMKDE